MRTMNLRSFAPGSGEQFQQLGNEEDCRGEQQVRIVPHVAPVRGSRERPLARVLNLNDSDRLRMTPAMQVEVGGNSRVGLSEATSNRGSAALLSHRQCLLRLWDPTNFAEERSASQDPHFREGLRVKIKFGADGERLRVVRWRKSSNHGTFLEDMLPVDELSYKHMR